MQQIAKCWAAVHLQVKRFHEIYHWLCLQYYYKIRALGNQDHLCRDPTVAKSFKFSIASVFIGIEFYTKPIISCLEENPSSICCLIRVFVGLKNKKAHYTGYHCISILI